MNRASFLKKTLTVASGVIVSGWDAVGSYKEPRQITVLHTNDTLGHVEPLGDSAPAYEGMGGMSRRAALLEKMRESPVRPIILDAGNVAGDTLYTDVHGSGLIYRMMSRMHYDATTLGEQDLKQGIPSLVKFLKLADFPVLVSNYETSDPELAPLLQSYEVLKRNNIRVGVFGLGFDGRNCETTATINQIKYQDPKLISEAMVRKLRFYEECDMVICLSRLGFHEASKGRYSDVQMAREISGLDMIIGGPPQLFMERGERIKGSDQSTTIVSQAGYGGAMMGRSSFEFEGSELKRKYSLNQFMG